MLTDSVTPVYLCYYVPGIATLQLRVDLGGSNLAKHSVIEVTNHRLSFGTATFKRKVQEQRSL